MTTEAPPTPAPTRRSPTKLVLYALGGLVVIMIPVMLLMGGSGERLMDVETADSQVRSITQTVTASGKVRPEVEVPISSEVSGEIVYLGVQEGDRVNEGQLLIRIRGDFYTAQREQAEAGLLQARADMARARAELVRAEADLNRQRDLHGRGVVPDSELEATETRAEVAQANFEASEYRVRSAEASLRQAGDQLRRTAIYAPMTGTVSMLNVELGQRVVGTAQMTGTEIMRIAELDQMEIEVEINENDVVNVSLGDSARVEVDAYPDRPLQGRVTQIANSARVTGAGSQDQVTSFPVKITLTSPHNVYVASREDLTVSDDAENPAVAAALPLLRPGMSGTVEVFTETVERAVVVPIQAVTVRDFNELRQDDGRENGNGSGIGGREDLRRVVFVVRDEKVEMIEVETGISDATHISVLRGLDGGETVVSGPFRTLRADLKDGDGIRARTTSARRTSS